MSISKISGGTINSSEITVDYKTRKINIHDTEKDDNAFSRVWTTWSDIMPFFIVIIISLIVFLFFSDSQMKWLFFQMKDRFGILIGTSELNRWSMIAFFVVAVGFSLLSISKKADSKIKKFFVEMTGNRKRNKISLSSLNDRELKIPDIGNIVLEYEARGDFKKYLDKVLIRKEDNTNNYLKQGFVNMMNLNKYKKKWNAYFIFDEIPKEGSLYIEWI